MNSFEYETLRISNNIPTNPRLKFYILNRESQINSRPKINQNAFIRK